MTQPSLFPDQTPKPAPPIDVDAKIAHIAAHARPVEYDESVSEAAEDQGWGKATDTDTEGETEASVARHPAGSLIIGHEAHIITVPPEEVNPVRQVPASFRKARAALVLPKNPEGQKIHDAAIDDSNKRSDSAFWAQQTK